MIAGGCGCLARFPLFWLIFLHSLVCACIASSHSIGWLLQTPLYRIGTPLRLIKSLGLFLCWCTIGMRIHLIMLCSIITHYQMSKYCIYVKMYSVISKNYWRKLHIIYVVISKKYWYTYLVISKNYWRKLHMIYSKLFTWLSVKTTDVHISYVVISKKYWRYLRYLPNNQ